MLDIGMTELLLIGIVALIVVGPKDLPGMFRTLGRFTAKARALGREFTRAMNDAADQSGMKDAADGLKAAANPKKFGMDKLTEAASNFEKWDPMKPSGKAKDDSPKIVDPEREADVAKIREATRKAGQAKLDAEKAAKEAEAEGEAKPAAKKAPAKKSAAKTTTARKTTKAAPAKSPAAKKPAAKKPAVKTATAKSATTAKSTTPKTPAKKPTAKSTPAKTSAAKPAAKAPAKKTTPRKAPAKKAASE
ncbi:MAG: twin-arginine translocase subunit TatB [Maritimibacter sp.]|uniref:Sec-independent protein translocase protein TatB n=1 Tax=Maritimibacter sp. TaxID=2003363 RepID=UPI001DC118E3|nr:Sec-independent protein translocase protein TatB [Maritimibacter sp.]MBL6426164.1 twin-arginine translocase subunit TatB [Maritimibacter sp.]